MEKINTAMVNFGYGAQDDVSERRIKLHYPNVVEGSSFLTVFFFLVPANDRQARKRMLTRRI